MQLYSPKELATLLRICEDKVYKLLKENQIKHSMIGARAIVRESDVEEYLKRTRVPKKTKVKARAKK